MISIRKTSEVQVDFADILRHSPVAGAPNAMEYLQRFLDFSSTTYIGYINGEIACLYGLRPATILSNSQTYLWLLTTDVIDRNKFEFIRNSEIVIENILKEYERIVGDTHVKDIRAFKWLRWLGAIYLNTHPLVQFYITRESFKARRAKR